MKTRLTLLILVILALPCQALEMIAGSNPTVYLNLQKAADGTNLTGATVTNIKYYYILDGAAIVGPTACTDLKAVDAA